MMKFTFLTLLPPIVAVTPVQKVIQMLNDMSAKGKQEKEDEQVRFSRFDQWCGDTRKDREQAIAEGNRKMEQLSSDMQKAYSDATMLGKEISELQANIAGWEADKKSATEVRNKEHSDFQTTHQDYSESIDALQRAIVTLKRQNFDRTQASLLQKDLKTVWKSSLVSLKDRKAIVSFLEKDPESPDYLNRAAPQANAYEFQSGGVIDMLQKLLDKFVDEKRTLETEEANARHSFEMMAQDLTDQVENATSESNDRSSTKSKREKDASQAKGDLASTTTVRNEDQKYLSDLNAECQQKKTDFENRQMLRGEELDAIAKAVEILSSGSVSGHADKHLPALFQKRKTSFVQLFLGQENPIQQRVASFLAERASSTNSRLLSAIASKVETDPFDKVRNMIRDLIVRLQEEATEETEHKGWCDTELATNKLTRDQKNQEVETLRATVESLQAQIAKLGQEIADLSQQVTDINKSVSEATAQRNEDKSKNEQTIADAKEAQVAVAQALSVLREFYSKAASATSLVQGAADDAPETFDTPYTGMQSESGGIVGMIEVIQSDFARLESETSAGEAEASKEYTTFMNDSGEDKAVKEQQIKNKERQKQQRESSLASAKKDLQGSEEELNAAMEYFDKLKPSCVDAGVSYEERVQRREEEIQSLKEALQILQGNAIE